MYKQLLIIFIFIITQSAFAQEKKALKITPDYDFKITSLDVFYPGQNIEAAKAKYKSFEDIIGLGQQPMVKFVVKDVKYHLSVFTQVHTDGTILSFYVRLPSYFLHDTFHQSLINKFGPQDEFTNYQSTASYVWNSKNGNKIYYRGSCTRTCFPDFLSAVLLDVPPEIGTFESLIDLMHISKFTGQ